jgi:hypothetical protein
MATKHFAAQIDEARVQEKCPFDANVATMRLAMENALLRMQCSRLAAMTFPTSAGVSPMPTGVPNWPQENWDGAEHATALSNAVRESMFKGMTTGQAPPLACHKAPTSTRANASEVAPADVVHDSEGDLGVEDDDTDIPPAIGPRVTLMVRNLPNNYSRRMLLQLMDSEGFAGQYDFVYLPIDFKSHASLGYAFINLASEDAARRFRRHFNGFSRWALPSQKVCRVSWSLPYQGLDAHIERYRNSPVMHEVVSDEFKPVLLNQGKRIAFPPPTKKIRAPRMRPGRNYARTAIAP